MIREHMVNHFSAIVGITLAVYAIWSMLLNPIQGPPPGTLLPIGVGVFIFTTGTVMLVWAVYRIYGYQWLPAEV